MSLCLYCGQDAGWFKVAHEECDQKARQHRIERENRRIEDESRQREDERRRKELDDRRREEDENRRIQDELRRARDEQQQTSQRALDEQHRIEAEQQRDRELGLTKHRDLVDKFLEITERKVSVVDQYGDENWDALEGEVAKFLAKIAKREPSLNLSKSSSGAYDEGIVASLSEELKRKFTHYHQSRKTLSSGVQDFSKLTGVDFEVYVADRLKEAGFDSVAGTPATGDQGADLIAKRNGKTIAIQAKGYSGSVGNGAVQEIVGALRFYNADEGWVVTNSTFTASARSLAQANNIRLIDAHDLKDFAALKHKL
jgi:restriction endonuclease Mrr